MPSTRAFLRSPRCGGELAREDLDVADDFDAACHRGPKERLAQRNTRTRNDRVHALQERFLEGSEIDANPGTRRADRSQGRRRRARVGGTQRARRAPRAHSECSKAP